MYCLYKTLIILLLLCGPCCLLAQEYNNVWIFGIKGGLDFNYDPPKPFQSNSNKTGLEPPYYISSICDSQGKLLFFTDGITVWDKNEKEMPRYLERWPWSGFMMPLICPYPGNDSLYYIFGVSDASYANRLQYLTVNAKAGKSGAIVYPQPPTLTNYFTRLLDNASLLVAGTGACNGKDFWITAKANNSLYSFMVTDKGVDSIPVVSSFPGVLPGGFINPGYGNIKFSASGERLILPSAADHAIFVFDFNNQTGKFSAPLKIRIDDVEEFEDAELSPDGSKLYYASEAQSSNPEIPGSFHDVYQFDLNAGNNLAIEKTKLKLSYSEHEACSPRVCFFVYKTLQLGPDEKIYVSQRTASIDVDHTASVIEFPNRAGTECFYKYNALDLKLKFSFINYNYIRSLNYTIEKNGIQIQKTNCKDAPVQFSLLYKNIDSVKWNFGDAASGDNNYSTALNPSHTYPAVGAYTAKAVIYTRCKADTASTVVNINDISTVHISDNVKDTTICKGQDFIYDATTQYATGYLWSTGLIYPTKPITEPGTYSITAYNECSVDKKSFTVAIEECNCKVFVPSAFTPNGDGLNDKFRPIIDCQALNYKFSVYNRFGQIEFSTENINDAWNGTIKSFPAISGTYIWRVAYRNPNDKKDYQKSGTVVLIR
ncbi:MAG TPA: gliding motility-associated C-terminal domain-containing protein [Parafilimonas sp.]|nr:gliding motility-associated C-terminal domain-containing protein [Parafilimonas sp.]